MYTTGRELWLEDHKERTQRGMRERVKAGKPRAGGKPQYGYVWRDADKSGLEPYAPEAEIVRRIFTTLANGGTATALLAQLTNEGIPSPGQKNGGPPHMWSTSRIGTIVRNDAYVGIAWAQKYRSIFKGRKRIRVDLIPEVERTMMPAGTIPALVTQELADKARATLIRNRTYTARTGDRTEFLVGYGIARCGICGHGLTAIRRKEEGRNPGYICPSAYKTDSAGYHQGLHMRASDLDEAVWERAKLVRANGDYVRQHLERMAEADTSGVELARIDRTRTALASQIANLTRAIGMVQSPDAMAPLVSQLEALSKTEAALAIEREALAQQQALLERTRHAVQSFTARVEADIDGIDNLTYQQRRDVLASLGVEVKVWPKGYPQRYEITMAYDISEWLDGAYYVPDEALEDDIEADIASGRVPAPQYHGAAPVRTGSGRERLRGSRHP